MVSFIRRQSSRSVALCFIFVFAITLAMALVPPLYFAASGVSALVLGLPFSVFYWILNAAILLFAVWAYYGVEHLRGDLDETYDQEGI